MKKVMEGTQDIKAKQPQVTKSTFGARKVRCQKCQGLAVPTPDGKGGYMLKCMGCGTTYLSTRLS